MANLKGFNANEVEPTTEFDPVPAGKYLAGMALSFYWMGAVWAGTGAVDFLGFTPARL